MFCLLSYRYHEKDELNIIFDTNALDTISIFQFCEQFIDQNIFRIPEISESNLR